MGFYLPGALVVDVEDYAGGGRSRCFDLLETGSVIAPMYLGPFRKGSSLDHLLENRWIDEVVLPAINLGRARFAGSMRYGELEVRKFGPNTIAERRFSRSRRRRDDEHHEAFAVTVRLMGLIRRSHYLHQALTVVVRLAAAPFDVTLEPLVLDLPDS